MWEAWSWPLPVLLGASVFPSVEWVGHTDAYIMACCRDRAKSRRGLILVLWELTLSKSERATSSLGRWGSEMGKEKAIGVHRRESLNGELWIALR